MTVALEPGQTRRPNIAARGEVRRVSGGLLDPRLLVRSTPDALRKLDPRVQFRNPVMFVVEVGCVLTTLSAIRSPSVSA